MSQVLVVFMAICLSACRADIKVARSTPQEDSGVVVVQLRKLSPLSNRKGGNFYVGKISVGVEPQEMRVVFDTSSGHVLVQHETCTSASCTEHTRYNQHDSLTATNVNIDGSPVPPNRTQERVAVELAQTDLGTGLAEGVLVSEKVCFGRGKTGPVCTQMDVLAADQTADDPFRGMPNDGIVGLGLDSLSINPEANFINRLKGAKGMKSQFGMYYGPLNGEIMFGGYDSTRISSPLQWFPVVRPDDGFWQVLIRAVRMGDKVIDSCPQGCRGIIDTSVWRVGVEEMSLPKLSPFLSATASPQGCQGQDLEFDLGGFSLKLKAQDYTTAACTADVVPLALGEDFKDVYALGGVLLRHYYAAFDWSTKLVGFSPLTERFVRLGNPTTDPTNTAQPDSIFL